MKEDNADFFRETKIMVYLDNNNQSTIKTVSKLASHMMKMKGSSLFREGENQ